MISRAANRTSSERSSAASLRPSIRVLNFSRVRSDAGILSIGVLLRGGRSPNRTSLVRLIRRGCTPTLFPASLGLHPPGKDAFLQTVTSSVENIVFPSVKIRSPSAISEQEKLSNSKLRIHTRTNSGRVTYRFL